MRIQEAPMYRVTHKLKKIKLDPKSWSKNTFGNLKNKVERNTDKLLQVESKLVQNPNSTRLNLFNQKYWGKMKKKGVTC